MRAVPRVAGKVKFGLESDVGVLTKESPQSRDSTSRLAEKVLEGRRDVLLRCFGLQTDAVGEGADVDEVDGVGAVRPAPGADSRRDDVEAVKMGRGGGVADTEPDKGGQDFAAVAHFGEPGARRR